MAALDAKRRQSKDRWESGNVLELSKDTQMLQNAAEIGLCQGFKWVQELDLEKLNSEIEDGID